MWLLRRADLSKPQLPTLRWLNVDKSMEGPVYPKRIIPRFVYRHFATLWNVIITVPYEKSVKYPTTGTEAIFNHVAS